MSDKSRIQFAWKRRPSEIRGYERAVYTTLDNGDYIRVDYNTGDNRARLYLEVQEENGASYYAIISQGRVTVERNSSGRSSRVAENLAERADDFSTIPNKDVLKLINNNYGITSKDETDVQEKQQKRKAELEETRRKYFKQDELNPYSDDFSGQAVRKRAGLIDLLDIMTGMLLAAVLFIVNSYSLLALGAALVLWGILIGLFDIVFRNREPIFLKILAFLISGTVIYVYSYLYL